MIHSKIFIFGASMGENVMSDDQLRTYLHRHPKTLAALFSLTVLLSQMGAVAANHTGIAGP